MAKRNKKVRKKVASPTTRSTLPPFDIIHNWSTIYRFSLIFILLLMTLMSFWYGISGDEIDMNHYGQAILEYYISFGENQDALDMPKRYDRDGVLHLYGGFFDLVAAIVNVISPFEEYTTRHILNAWCGFLAIFFASRIGRLVAGVRCATIITWLMFLAPFFLGHAMNNPKDIPFATAYIAAIYLFLKFHQKLPEVGWKDYLPPIIALAIAIDIRVAGILLIPYMGIFHFLKCYFIDGLNKQALLSGVRPLLIISVLGYLGASLLWPYALQNPILNPIRALGELSDFKVSLGQVFEGKRIGSSELPSYYLIKNILITNPYIITIGLLLCAVLYWVSDFSRRHHYIIFIAFVTLFPLFYIIYKGSNVYHAWRHVLFIFPSLAILAGLGIHLFLNRFRSRNILMIGYGFVLLLLLEPTYFIVKSFPNTICYYNAFVGGTEQAYRNYEMDSYYNTVKQSADWFIDNVIPSISKSDTIIVAATHGGITREYLKDYPNVKVTYVRFHERIQKKWDYAIFHRALVAYPLIKRGNWAPSGTIYTAAVDKNKPLSVVVKRLSMADYEGYQLLKAEKHNEAFKKFLEYNSIDPKNELVNNILARYFKSMGDETKANKVLSGNGIN